MDLISVIFLAQSVKLDCSSFQYREDAQKRGLVCQQLPTARGNLTRQQYDQLRAFLIQNSAANNRQQYANYEAFVSILGWPGRLIKSHNNQFIYRWEDYKGRQAVQATFNSGQMMTTWKGEGW